MNIQRKYSLPNCTLLLEGLSDASKTTQLTEMRPELSILVNAECTLSGYAQTLAGGREFFESLVRAVSAYAQEFLSHVSNPQAHDAESELVQLEKVHNNCHRLSVHSDIPQGNINNSGNGKQTIKINLNSVQLFDLVEAVDQFFADTQTLPELTLELQPVARGRGALSDALLKQAVPASVGLGSLAAAAIAFNLIPAPEFKEPSTAQNGSNSNTTQRVAKEGQPTSESNKSQENPTPTQSPSSSTSASNVKDLEKLLSSVPEIKNAKRLGKLNTQVYQKFNQAWKDRQTLGSDLTYRVGVVGDGTIIGYKAVDKIANDAIEDTPLPKVLYNPASSGKIANEPIGQFKVVFRRSGALEVSPWIGYINKSHTIGTNITDQNTVSDLNEKLSTSLKNSGGSDYKEDLKYRVAVKKDGSIADYEPLNKASFDNFRQTPIPKLFQGDNTLNAEQKEPLAQFQVEFKPGGEVEVRPWQGYR